MNEQPQVKTGGFNMMKMLILFGMIPLVTIGVALIIIASSTVKREVQSSIREKLETANKAFNQYTSDWVKEGGEEEWLGDPADKDYAYVDSFKDQHVEFTIFLGDTRVLTSITDNSGKRLEGTKASDQVVAECLKGGRHYSSDGVEINGKPYFVDYLPLKDPDGNIIGMTFAGETDANVNRAVNSATKQMIIIAIILVVVFALIIIIISLKVRAPLVEISDALNKIASGDLSSDITVTSSITENKNMITSMRYMQTSLQNIVSDIMTEADSLSDGVSSVERLSGASAESTDQITSAMGQLAAGAMSMAENVSDINEQMVDMGNKVAEIEENVSGLTENARRMSEVSDDATKHMNEVMRSSENTVTAVDQINKQILVTNESIEKIDDAITFIIDIANQTNLLALNAAIEAARAGEAGRGFAVVADSISSLSEQSNQSAASIRAIASEVLQNSKASVSLADKIRHTIEEEQNVIAETQERFDALNASIDESVEEIAVINEKATDLQEIKNILLDHVEGLSAISEENAANNEEVNASVESISQGISDIASQMKDMDQMSKNLGTSISHFS